MKQNAEIHIRITKEEKQTAQQLADKFKVGISDVVRAGIRFLDRNQAVAKAELRDD